MFFDNAKFYQFVDACRSIGITVPIIPGLKPIYSKKQLTVLPKTFHIDLPPELSAEILKCKTDEEVEKIGQDWLLMQSKDLKKNGVPVLHYYTLGKPHLVANVVREL
jgi:methylenetetrahydrofolate reductase (NADPH)